MRPLDALVIGSRIAGAMVETRLVATAR
jgi:hypothetical protein